MCGITGGFAFTDGGKPIINKITGATDCIKHRGPDGGGVFQSERVVLGHRRLSIIDTSSAADQPMYSADGRYCIVFNGEIFNYQTLADTYLQGHTFTTTSDTEVLLQLFTVMGTGCFSLLRGFFALAIYDKQTDTVTIARDRYGKKPVHYYKDDVVLLFASELKALLAFGITKELHTTALPYYFQLNYIPQPLSLVKGVQKLMPGHYMVVSGNGVEQHRYYELKVQKEKYGQYTYEGAQKKLVELLEEATKLRLIADVPVGSFLSGGIDSSVVVALASRHKKQLNTFSIGYKDHPFFDETAYANLVAKKFGTNHTVFSLGNDDFLQHIDAILDSIDEPFADSSTIPTYILSKETRKYVTVALSGDGGDEVFAGYNKHHAELKASGGSFSRNLVKGLAPLWKVLPKSRNNKLTNTIRQLHRFAEGAQLAPAERYWRWASMMPEAEVQVLLHNKQVPESLISHFTKGIDGGDLNDVLAADMGLVLLGDMLVKVDMMSMANSLEIRSPFLDGEVVDFAFGLPVQYKIDGGMKKRIVQDAFRSLLPAELYNRPKKGFDIPLLDWFRKELWSKIDGDLLKDSYIKEQQLFDLAAIQSLKKKLKSNNPEDSHETIWALMVFQHWWRRNMQ